MKTVKDIYQQYHAALQTVYHSNEIASITDLVLTEITGFSRAKLKAFTDIVITVEQENHINNILQELQTCKPVQYIIGHTDFYGLDFKVNASVLIPRPETEELVDWVINTAKQLAIPQQVLDIGTGSGCIAISVKKNLPKATVTAVDISIAALQTARDNALQNQTEVNFIEADILNIQMPTLLDHSFSVIVSNPPYVTNTDKAQMHTNVTDFEPHTALFVPDECPLIFYEAIADFAATHLQKGGFLFFEINESYGKEVIDLLRDKTFTNIELKADMSNRERMVKALWLN